MSEVKMEMKTEELCNIDFKDAFSFEELKKSMEDDSFIEKEACCFVCGNELENLKIGFNAKKQMHKFECSNCSAIYVIQETSEFIETVILQGEERNWPEYLAETLILPFFAEVEDDGGRSFFNSEYEGPSTYDTVKVLDVHYAMNYGVVAEVQKGNTVYPIALCFLVALDDHNYKELENYKRWRENYWRSDLLAALFGEGEDE